MKITKVNKAIVTGIAGILDVIVAVMADNVVDMSEKQHIITTVLTIGFGVFAVWYTPNAKGAPKDTPDA